MSRKRTLFIAAGLLAAVGATAAVWAQGHRGHWHGGPMHFGDDGHGLGGFGGFRGRFAGPLTKEEHDARTRERFARLDRNSDGAIDAAELEAAIGERMGAMQRMREQAGARMAERMMRFFDANKDGKVTREEHQAGVRKLFAEMDLNNDGRISDDDLPPMMRGRNALAGGGPRGLGGMGMGFPLMRLLADADANKDGVITLDEGLAAADKRFALYDRNKDGAIDKADLDALRKEMVDYRVKRFIHHHGADKDGKVTREQFTEKARERFARMDLNDDGTIARDEMPGRGRWFGRGRGGPDGMGPDHGMGPGDMGPGGMGPGGMGPGGHGPRRGSGSN